MEATRSILGVAVSFVAMSFGVLAVSVAPWFLLGLDGVMRPASFQTTAAITAYAVCVGIVGALAAGWLCGRITSSRYAVLSLAVLCLLGGLTNAFGQWKKPEPGIRVAGVTVGDAIAQRKEPAWFTLAMPCLGVAGVLFGGRRATRPGVIAGS